MTFSQQSSFFGSELQNALAEQAFGIASFELAMAGPLQAGAKVTLLEGPTISITLTGRGYHWHAQQSQQQSSASSDRVYESIEDLLLAVSPLYERRRQELLISRLERLQ